MMSSVPSLIPPNLEYCLSLSDLLLNENEHYDPVALLSPGGTIMV